MTALLTVAKTWKDVPSGVQASDQAQALLLRLLHEAEAIKEVPVRGRQELAIAKLMPTSMVGELAMDDALVLSRQMAN